MEVEMAFCFRRLFTFRPRLVGEVRATLFPALLLPLLLRPLLFILVEPNLVAAKVAVVKVKGCVERGMKVGLTAAEWPNGGEGEVEPGEAAFTGSAMGMKTCLFAHKLPEMIERQFLCFKDVEN
ncbi:hypothetical protein EYF80_032114 [Liparis tanakae]|uniref:Uncharacterized protein n=1 Tax=Liparis tanakae TaxID=230148 RepID=A0A4Z2GYB8_9TELE|nr:hypothetical protein EYF80_032114 [Liparis tanakae]